MEWEGLVGVTWGVTLGVRVGAHGWGSCTCGGGGVGYVCVWGGGTFGQVSVEWGRS